MRINRFKGVFYTYAYKRKKTEDVIKYVYDSRVCALRPILCRFATVKSSCVRPTVRRSNKNLRLGARARGGGGFYGPLNKVRFPPPHRPTSESTYFPYFSHPRRAHTRSHKRTRENWTPPVENKSIETLSRSGPARAFNVRFGRVRRRKACAIKVHLTRSFFFFLFKLFSPFAPRPPTRYLCTRTQLLRRGLLFAPGLPDSQASIVFRPNRTRATYSPHVVESPPPPPKRTQNKWNSPGPV